MYFVLLTIAVVFHLNNGKRTQDVLHHVQLEMFIFGKYQQHNDFSDNHKSDKNIQLCSESQYNNSVICNTFMI